jgi:acyl-CoA synthetase (AMP-forming)/AMP-acid ligase II
MTEPDTLLGCLERASSTDEGVRFLERDLERFVRYRDVLERASGIAAALVDRGIGRGRRVGIAVETSPDFYHAFFGVVAAGAVPVSLPLPPRFGKRADYKEDIAAMLEAAGATVVLAQRSQQPRFAAHGTHEAISIEELSSARNERFAAAADDVALVQLSSGTTGAPKAIGLTHRQVLANVREITRVFFAAYPPAEGYRHAGVSWLPLYHDMGLVGSVLTALAHPGPLTLLKPEEFVARPARWLEAISRYRATISAAPHFAYQFALDRIRDEELEGVDLSCWLFALDGAESVTPSTLEGFCRRFARHGFRREALTPVYGLAEASLAVTFSDPRRPFRWKSFDQTALVEGGQAREVPPGGRGLDVVSCGQPIQGFEIRIAGGEGEPLPEAALGRVLLRGPSIASEWAGQDGFLDTGDRGFLVDGELYLFGRTKEAVVLRGRSYPPEMIEQAAEGASGVRAGAVAAVSILTRGGDGLCLLAERGRELGEDGDADTVEALRAHVVARCGVLPDRIVLLDPGSLPRTSSGKIRRREAARRFADSTGRESL